MDWRRRTGAGGAMLATGGSPVAAAGLGSTVPVLLVGPLLPGVLHMTGG